VIALAYGPHKVHPILGALRTGCINVLVTDRWTAETVLVTDSLKAEQKSDEASSHP